MAAMRLRRCLSIVLLLLGLLAAQQLALWHDVGHLDGGAPPALDCKTHYLCAQVGGGPASEPAAIAVAHEPAAAESFVRQRAASLPTRRAYLAQAPPAALR